MFGLSEAPGQCKGEDGSKEDETNEEEEMKWRSAKEMVTSGMGGGKEGHTIKPA